MKPVYCVCQHVVQMHADSGCRINGCACKRSPGEVGPQQTSEKEPNPRLVQFVLPPGMKATVTIEPERSDGG